MNETRTLRTGRGLAVVMLALLLGALPALAQMEMDRPTPPGEEPPATPMNRLTAAGTAEDHPGHDYVIVHDLSLNQVMGTGVTYVNLYTLYKVLTDEGVKQLSSLRWDYDPRSSFIEVSEVNILRDGERISVPVDRVKDLPAPQSAIYWSNRVKLLQLPRLQPGDGIEVKAMRKGYNYALLAEGEGAAAAGAPVTMDARERIGSPDDDRYIPPMEGEYFDIVVFQANVPVLERKYVLSIPRGKRLISQVFNKPLYTKTDYTADSTYYSWWGLNLPAEPSETRQPDSPDISAKVVMTTAESWDAKSRWFWDVNQNQFEVTDAIEQKVQEILKEAGVEDGTDMEKAKALNHWVAQNIRYSGQTMGEGEGFTLHPSDVLIKYRSGVCKDIASMSITFLRAAGLDAYPAMTMAGSTIEDLPADQFNHCVVAWEKEPGSFVMLDPTWVPYNNDIWSKLETEQEYVIGHPEGVEDLKEIRYSPPEESPLKVTHKAELGEDGSLKGTLRLEGSGALDSRLRRIVYQTAARKLEATVAGILATVGEGVVIDEVSHRVVDDFDGDMWLEVSYHMPRFALPVDGGLEFTAPAVNMVKDHGYLFRAGSGSWGEERETDVFLYYTQRLDIDETITLPEGFDHASVQTVESVDATFAAFESGSEIDGNTLELNTLVDVRRRQIPPSGYDGFRKAIEHLDDWADNVIRVAKEGSK